MCCDDPRKFEITINNFCIIMSIMNLLKNKTIQFCLNLFEGEVFFKSGHKNIQKVRKVLGRNLVESISAIISGRILLESIYAIISAWNIPLLNRK